MSNDFNRCIEVWYHGTISSFHKFALIYRGISLNRFGFTMHISLVVLLFYAAPFYHVTYQTVFCIFDKIKLDRWWAGLCILAWSSPFLYVIFNTIQLPICIALCYEPYDHGDLMLSTVGTPGITATFRHHITKLCYLTVSVRGNTPHGLNICLVGMLWFNYPMAQTSGNADNCGWH